MQNNLFHIRKFIQDSCQGLVNRSPLLYIPQKKEKKMAGDLRFVQTDQSIQVAHIAVTYKLSC
jgi:hypothetical protein